MKAIKRSAQYLLAENSLTHCGVGLDMTYRILCWQETNFGICSVANHCGYVLPGIKSFTLHGSVARDRVGVSSHRNHEGGIGQKFKAICSSCQR